MHAGLDGHDPAMAMDFAVEANARLVEEEHVAITDPYFMAGTFYKGTPKYSQVRDFHFRPDMITPT